MTFDFQGSKETARGRQTAMVNLIIGIFSGAIASWVIAHFYYRKSNHDQNDLFNKLPEYIRQAVLEDQREKLSVKELNELIRLKTIDKMKKGFEAFKACPKCGSKNITVGDELYDVDVSGSSLDDATYSPIFIKCITCQECGWKKTEADDLEI